MKPNTRKKYIQMFHPISVEDAVKGTTTDMCLQGINKWIGVMHAVNNGAYIYEGKLLFPKDHSYFGLSGKTCAICSFYHNDDAQTKKEECEECPLYHANNRRCDTPKGEHTLALQGDAAPMISLLNKIMIDDMGES
jgi:hypothetical protein